VMAYRKGTHTRGLFLSAAALLTAASPAHAADQFKQTVDGAGIECSVSARELTRFALVDDQFASVSKISTGTPYNDFAVTNEPVRGDIYVSVPETYAARAISFFATTKRGFRLQGCVPGRADPGSADLCDQPGDRENQSR